MSKPTTYIEVAKGRLLWHVRIVSRNGNIKLSSETYFSKSNATRAARLLAKELNLPLIPKEN